MRTLGRIFRENKSLLLFVFLLAMFRGAVADWHPVPTGSMKPTILEGDVVFQNKLAYDLKIPFTDISLMRLGEPKRGDIVVFNSKAADKRLIKRLVGMPGDLVAVIDHRLFINNEFAEYIPVDQELITSLRSTDKEPGSYLIESVAGLPGYIVNIEKRPYSQNFQYQVPVDEYFFMGDNRDNSAGSVPRKELRGKAIRKLVSLDINNRYKPRFERFFEGLY